MLGVPNPVVKKLFLNVGLPTQLLTVQCPATSMQQFSSQKLLLKQEQKTQEKPPNKRPFQQ